MLSFLHYAMCIRTCNYTNINERNQMKNPDGRYLLPTTFTYKGGEVQVKLTGAQIARLRRIVVGKKRLLHLIRQLHRLSVAHHEAEIAMHTYKRLKADERLQKRLERLL